MHGGHRRRGAVGKGEGHVPDSEALGDFPGTSGEVQVWPAAGLAADLQFLPRDAMLDAGAEGLGSCLLGGKSSREALGAVLFVLAVSDLPGSEDPREKTLSKALNRLRNAVDFDHIDAGSDEHEGTLHHSYAGI